MSFNSKLRRRLNIHMGVTMRHLRATGEVSLAQYNPPWRLWILRRNEVMIPIEANP
ncbi:heme-binding protein [Thermomonas sp.]